MSENNQNHLPHIITLPEYTNLNAEIIDKLDGLFDFASPKEWRECVMEVYLIYLMTHYDSLPDNFEKLAANFYFLFDFLSCAEREALQ